MKGSESRVAGLDLGTNSFLLLILARTDRGERVVLDQSEIVGLGDGLDRTGRIGAAAAERALTVLETYRRLCDQHGVTRIEAVGTAAFRIAANRADLLARIEERTGITVRVISGEEEAELTYRDVAHTHGGDDRPLTLVDIGGGSTEIVAGRRGHIESLQSVEIGSRRLWERAGPLADPLGPEDLARLDRLAAEALGGLAPTDGDVVGTGGTITTLAAIALDMSVYDAEAVNRAQLTTARLDELIAMLAALPLEERRLVPGLPPKRADVIVPGAVILVNLMRGLGVDSIRVSAGGLRFAVARRAWEKDGT